MARPSPSMPTICGSETEELSPVATTWSPPVGAEEPPDSQAPKMHTTIMSGTTLRNLVTEPSLPSIGVCPSIIREVRTARHP